MTVFAATVTAASPPAGAKATHWAATRRRPVPAAPTTVVPMGWRYCPDCLRTEAAVLHTDGTATCDHCHTHIEATEMTP